MYRQETHTRKEMHFWIRTNRCHRITATKKTGSVKNNFSDLDILNKTKKQITL